MSEKNVNKPAVRFSGFTEDWEQRKWKDCVDISTEMVDPRKKIYEYMPHIAPGNIESFTGQLYNNVKLVKDENLISGKFHFYKGDIIYGKINPQLGKYYLSKEEGLTSADSYVLNTKNGLVQHFLYTVLQTEDFYKYSVSVSRRSGMPKINRDELNAFSFLAPSEEEQKKISKIFLSLDNLLTLHQRKCEQLKATKTSLLQKMFPKEGEKVPEVRFAGFTEDWEQCQLKDIAERVARKNSDHETNLPLTISAEYGLVDQITYFNNRVASANLSGYYLLYNGEFAYNKSTSSASPWGAIKRLDRYDKGAVSTLYIAFKLKENVNSDYIVAYYETDRWYKEVKLIAAEGARNHGLLNIAPDDFFKMKMSIPKSVDEQQKIGEIFTFLDSLLILHQRKCEQLKAMKTALLQKMFV